VIMTMHQVTARTSADYITFMPFMIPGIFVRKAGMYLRRMTGLNCLIILEEIPLQVASSKLPAQLKPVMVYGMNPILAPQMNPDFQHSPGDFAAAKAFLTSITAVFGGPVLTPYLT
jgi:hypothetical protein